LQSLLFRSGLSLLLLKKSSLPGFAEIRALQHSIWQYLRAISLLFNNLKWSCQKPRISNSYLKVLIPIDWTSEGWWQRLNRFKNPWRKKSKRLRK
jgi:hypothetical protein